MTLQLDARQRAMLEEMGIKIWQPLPEPDTAPATAAPTAPLVPAVSTTPAAAPLPPIAAATPAKATWDDRASEAAPAPHRPAPAVTPPVVAAPIPATAPRLLITPPERLYASDAQAEQGGWLVVVDLPPDAAGRHDALLAGEAGRLLDQMLRALQLHSGSVPVHVLRLWRAAPGQLAPENALDFDSAFEQAVRPLAPQLVLALGPNAAQRLTGQQAPLGRLRGSVHAVQAGLLGELPCAVVASYPPAYLLRNSADKAKAWADLCLAADSLAATPA